MPIRSAARWAIAPTQQPPPTASKLLARPLPPRRSESSRAASRIPQLCFVPLHRLIARHHQLRNAIAFFYDVRGTAQVKHDYANLAAITGVDRAEVNRHRVLQPQPAARPHLRFVSRRQLDRDPRRYALR